MKRRSKLTLLLAACLGVALPAQAEQPRGWQLAGPHVMISAERAASALFWSGDIGVGPSAPDTTFKPQGFDISLLSSRAAASPSSLPRFGADYVTPGGLSFGATLGLGYVRNRDGTGPNAPKHSVREIIISPRLGYLAPLSPRIALWPRLGVSGGLASSSTRDQHYSSTLWNLTLDPQLVVVLVPRVVFTTGALFETGGVGGDGISGHPLAYGVTAGFAAMF